MLLNVKKKCMFTSFCCLASKVRKMRCVGFCTISSMFYLIGQDSLNSNQCKVRKWEYIELCNLKSSFRHSWIQKLQ